MLRDRTLSDIRLVCLDTPITGGTADAGVEAVAVSQTPPIPDGQCRRTPSTVAPRRDAAWSVALATLLRRAPGLAIAGCTSGTLVTARRRDGNITAKAASRRGGDGRGRRRHDRRDRRGLADGDGLDAGVGCTTRNRSVQADEPNVAQGAVRVAMRAQG